jgi:nucleotide-binding universal stress UspA family protein
LPYPVEATRILVAYDGSEQSLRAIEWTTRFARPEVTVITVVPTLAGSERIADAVPPGARERVHGEPLTGVFQALAVLDIPTSLIETSGNAAEEIIRVAEEGGFDVVVVGSQGLNAIERFLLGSVSARVMRFAPCPVLVVR